MYIFPYPRKAPNLNSNDTEMAKIVVDLWTTFVKNGIPKLTFDPHFEWPPMTSTEYINLFCLKKEWLFDCTFHLIYCIGDTGQYLHIDEELVLDDDFTEEYFVY